MAWYAVGDVQGCMRSLELLLQRIGYRRGRDKIWLAGDLVNRGPRSADVLRWARDAGDDVVAVLGNHDIHLLARAAGVGAARRRDTLGDVLDAPDAADLLAWLGSRPLLHREGRFVMVHAGLLPGWSVEEAAVLARGIEGELRGPRRRKILDENGITPRRWRFGMEPNARMRLGLTVLTKIRLCDDERRLDLRFAGRPSEAPPGFRPWFAGRPAGPDTIVTGHWSRLGLHVGPGRIALDTGCVYGGCLTAVRLDDGVVFQQPYAEGI